VSEASPDPAIHDPAPRRGRILAACLLVAFALLALPGLRHDSTTYDEPGFYMYGYGVLAKGDFSRDGTQNSKMPFNALQAAPGYLREWLGGPRAFKPESGVWLPEEGALGLGRAVTLATALVLGVLLARIARPWGRDVVLATLVLFALDPNLLAHARYVTTDVPCAAATALVVLAAAALAERATPARAAAAGGALGLALLVKYTAVHVFIGAALGLAALAWRDRRDIAPESRRRRLALAALAFVAALVLAIDAGYLFQGLPGHFPDPVRSRKLAAIAPLGRAPLPVSSWFWDGLDWVTHDEESFHGPLTFLGRLDLEGHGSLLYYPLVLALKLPIPLMALLVIAAAGALGRGPAARPGRRWSALEVISAAVATELLLYFVLLFRLQIGLRHLLPALALLLVPAGHALASLWRGSRATRGLAGALVLWQALSVLSFFPTFLPYVNELVPDRKLTYRVFADSNIDWGQARRDAMDWVVAERRKGRVVWMDPDRPVAGTVVVSANAVLGLIGRDHERFAWLRDKTPVGHVAYAYLVFEVKPEELPK
jgi:hypothetical protein